MICRLDRHGHDWEQSYAISIKLLLAGFISCIILLSMPVPLIGILLGMIAAYCMYILTVLFFVRVITFKGEAIVLTGNWRVFQITNKQIKPVRKKSTLRIFKNNVKHYYLFSEKDNDNGIKVTYHLDNGYIVPINIFSSSKNTNELHRKIDEFNKLIFTKNRTGYDISLIHIGHYYNNINPKIECIVPANKTDNVEKIVCKILKPFFLNSEAWLITIVIPFLIFSFYFLIVVFTSTSFFIIVPTVILIKFFVIYYIYIYEILTVEVGYILTLDIKVE